VDHFELVVFGLLVAVSALAVLARLARIPYPILLVLGGLAFGFIPGVPDVQLEPDLVLLLFLPPLLYSAAFFSNLRELRSNARPISTLAIGLVIATMVTVALVAHEVIGLSWPVAFVLGAVVSPTDAVAPAEILRRLSVPRRVVSIVEGENLTNDWTALVAYKFAVAAVVTGSFSLLEAGPEFIYTGIAGVAVGVAAGALIAAVRRRVEDPITEITISLLTAYAAYLPAEAIGGSGVLAAVTAGVWLGWRASELTNHTTRLQLTAIWQFLVFLLNAVLFVLVGLQLPSVLDQLSGRTGGELAGYGALIALVVIVGLRAVACGPPDQPGRPTPQPAATVGPDHAGGLGGHARVGVAGRRAGDPNRDRLRRCVPRARSGDLSGLLRDPGHAGDPGTAHAGADPGAGRGARHRGRGRGAQRPAGDRFRRAGPDRGAGR
jgi:CPA1 family monovalent cation:H+ antiporter